MATEFKFDILDSPAFQEFNSLVGVYKFGDPLSLYFKAVESFVNSEIINRKARRAAALGLPKGCSEYQESLSMLHNTQGLRRLKKAGVSIKAAITEFPNVLKKENELVSTQEMKQILTDYDAMLKNEIFEMDLTEVEAKEVWDEYNKARKIVDAKGMSGLISHASAKIDELTTARTDLAKGRAPASPLPYWKIVAIAVGLCVAITAVVYCYKKKNCKWVWDVVKVTSIFLFNLIKSGC